MTSYSVFVGRLGEGPDPLDFGGDWNCNLPTGGSPQFPPSTSLKQPFSHLLAQIENGILLGKQVDWGAWAAKVSKVEILQFLSEAYPDEDWCKDINLGPNSDILERQTLLVYLRELSDDRLYALVAVES